jgi:flavin-dependent dehydrogenase
VGDAALARDVLSSQGMATGLSSACYAAAAESENDCALVLQHQLAERARHLQSLSQLVAACRYGNSVEWQRYTDFIGNHLEDAPHDTIRLSEGRLRSVRHVVFGASPKSA